MTNECRIVEAYLDAKREMRNAALRRRLAEPRSFAQMAEELRALRGLRGAGEGQAAEFAAAEEGLRRTA